VLKEVLYKVYKNPLGLLKRAIFKTLIAPFKYRKGNDYDAQKYWHDRFSKYGKTLTASGDEGLSEEENRRDYERAINTMMAVFRKENIDFEQTQALEIGCGLKLLKEKNATKNKVVLKQESLVQENNAVEKQNCLLKK